MLCKYISVGLFKVMKVKSPCGCVIVVYVYTVLYLCIHVGLLILKAVVELISKLF